jgi:hypothetical protein
MTRLHRLHTEHGQSPWLDNLTRDSLDDGTLRDLIHAGIRGVTANPSIFAHAMSSSHAYTGQLEGLLRAGTPLEDAYWELVIADITRAADLFAPLYESSGGGDGFALIVAGVSLGHVGFEPRSHHRVLGLGPEGDRHLVVFGHGSRGEPSRNRTELASTVVPLSLLTRSGTDSPG